MKFSGVFIVAEVWLATKLKLSVVIGIDRICKRVKLLISFLLKFSSLSMFHQNVVTFYKKKNFLGFLFMVNSKEVYLIF